MLTVYLPLRIFTLRVSSQTFTSLIPPAPSAPSPPPPSAYLYLAQLSEDDPHTALKHYEAAVAILHAQLKGKDRAVDDVTGESEADIRKNLVRVLVAMVEIWMSPVYELWYVAKVSLPRCLPIAHKLVSDDPKAEETCDALLTTAFETDPENVEALICLSSFRLSQQRPEEAKEAAMKAWLSWKDIEDGVFKCLSIPMLL